MMRLGPIVLAWIAAGAVASVVAAPAPASASASADAWTETLLPMADRGWEPLAQSASAVVYLSFREATRAGAIATASMRKEYREDHRWMGYFAARSVVSTIEVDCARRAMRDLSSTGYASSNLSGESKSWTADRPTLWSPVEAGTVGADAVREVCRRTRPRDARNGKDP